MTQGANGKSGRSHWFWLLLVVWIIALAEFARAAYWAFQRPWTWANYQTFFVLFCLGVAIAVGNLLFIWLRGGNSSIRQHWRRLTASPFAPRSRRWIATTLLFWIAVAFALILFFNWNHSFRYNQ